MSAQTADGTEDELPAVPEGWERVEPGSPLLEAVYREDRVRLRLQWCPACGPEEEVFQPGGGRRMETHILEYHSGFPEDFGLGVDEQRDRDSRLREFEEVDGDG